MYNNQNGESRVGGIPFPSNANGMQGNMQTYQQVSPFTQDPVVSGFQTNTSVRNKNWHVTNVLTMLFGEGFSFNAQKVPEEEMFPDKIRHFDRTGFSYMQTQHGVYQSVGVDGVVVNVVVTYAVCHACKKVYYRVEDVY